VAIISEAEVGCMDIWGNGVADPKPVISIIVIGFLILSQLRTSDFGISTGEMI